MATHQASKTRLDPQERSIAARVRQRRIESGKTPGEMADYLSVSRQMWLKYEGARSKISAGVLADIARAMGTPIVWFYSDIKELPGITGASNSDTIQRHPQGARLLKVLADVPNYSILKPLADLADAFRQATLPDVHP